MAAKKQQAAKGFLVVTNENHMIYSEPYRGAMRDFTKRKKEVEEGLRKLLPEGTWAVQHSKDLTEFA